MTKYYAMDGDVPIGAFTDEELLSSWKEGKLLPNDLCWAHNMKQWQPISEIESVQSWEENFGHYPKTRRETDRWVTLKKRQYQSSHLESKALRNIHVKDWIWAISYLALVVLILFWINNVNPEHVTAYRFPAIALILLSALGFIKYGKFELGKSKKPADLGRMISRSTDRLRECLTEEPNANADVKIWGESASTHSISPEKSITVISGYAEMFRLGYTSSEDYLAQFRWRAVFLEQEGLPLIIEEVGRVAYPRLKKS